MKEKLKDGVKFVYDNKKPIGMALSAGVTVLYQWYDWSSDDSDSGD